MLIPLGHNADTTSALKKSILLLHTKPQILCWGKHFAQNMCTIALVCRMGERQGEMERATHRAFVSGTAIGISSATGFSPAVLHQRTHCRKAAGTRICSRIFTSPTL